MLSYKFKQIAKRYLVSTFLSFLTGFSGYLFIYLEKSDQIDITTSLIVGALVAGLRLSIKVFYEGLIALSEMNTKKK
jgi:hypothetical protein